MPHYQVPLVGMHYRPPAKAFLQILPQAHPLHIEPEPENPYDANALKVNIRTDEIPNDLHEDLQMHVAGFGFSLEDILAQPIWHLGYIAKDQAAALQPMLDSFDITKSNLLLTGEKPQVDLELVPKAKASP